MMTLITSELIKQLVAINDDIRFMFVAKPCIDTKLNAIG